MSYRFPKDSPPPLNVDEVINCLRKRWKYTYDVRLVVRSERLYFQVMWAYLEQQSFPIDEKAYRIHLNDVLEVINRLGLASVVREWLFSTNQKPMLGRAMTFPLKTDGCLDEFIV